ncbi:Plamodium exported protein [Plasmodium gonderi]|uniref:Plamodium exported protein n=1 Tax=Plasmodium gonderi TaxID=77519 RepID=A0A1Y1JQA3_PLAGO|nr:Plamodium exported protein [Plasmodium gonderi]GAW84609.1 Plamodium exported protein [Plasmodium gonderi]
MNYHLNKKKSHLFLFKILALILVIFMYYFHNESNYEKSYNEIHNFQDILDWKNRRLLSSHEHKGCKPNILKRIDKHFENKIFSLYNNVAKLGDQENYNPNELKTKIVKTLFIVMRSPLIVFLLASVLMAIGKFFKYYPTLVAFPLLITSLLMGMYIFIKSLKFLWNDASEYLKSLDKQLLH